MSKDGSIVRPDWQTPDATPVGQLLNAIQFSGLEKAGIRTVPGSLDVDGLEVVIAGEHWRVELVRVDRRPCPMDGHPVFDRGNPANDRASDRLAALTEGYWDGPFPPPVDPGD